MKILFLRPTSAFMPEVDAYCEALKIARIAVEIRDESYSPSDRCDVDVVYRFGGFLRRPSSLVPEIHEYASVSTGRLPRTKNLIKSSLSSTPIKRVFLSPFVKSQLPFRNEVPHIFRDMGVSPEFYKARNSGDKSFDLVYVGSVDGRRGVKETLLGLGEKGFRVLVAGSTREHTAKLLRKAQGITYLGLLKPSEIPHVVSQATHGLDIRPAEYPHPHQTSTKVLEYLAAGLTVVSETYQWINEHSAQVGYEYVELSRLSRSGPKSLPSTDPLERAKVVQFEWGQVLKNSGFVEFVSGSCRP